MLNTLLDITQQLAKVGGWAISYGDEKVVHWTPAIFEIFEHEQGTPFSLEESAALILPAYFEKVSTLIVRCRDYAEPCDVEFAIRTRKGNEKWVRLVTRAEINDTGSVIAIVGALQDLTAQKLEEESTRLLSQRLLNAIENMSDAFYMLDRDWRLIYVNKAADILMSRNRVVGTGDVLWDLFPYLRETPMYDGFFRAMRNNTHFHYEYFSNAMNNWIELDAYPSPEGLAVYFHSITERKLMQERLDRAQHMESIGKLTGHVAHDFNNLLTIILGNAELLHDMYSRDEKLRRIAENIRTASLKGSELTRRLLSYARKQTLAPRPIDINHLVQGMRELLVRTLGVNISITLKIASNLPPALVDEHQLEGALLNLSINARDAMPQGGELTISTAAVYIDPAEAASHSDFKTGHYIRIRISDTGTGISPDILKQVFEPFFTTKELGKGTGLGLSSVYGFAKQSNGHVTIASTLAVGTTVDLLLPVSRTPVADTEVKAEPAQGGNETILVVDDDELVRNAVQSMLGASLGYQVLAVASGETALTVLRGPTRVDLMFSDVMMPGMNGHDLARLARELRPDLRILLTSGYVSPSLTRSNGQENEFPLLPKPYSRQQLARFVRDMLDRPG